MAAEGIALIYLQACFIVFSQRGQYVIKSVLANSFVGIGTKQRPGHFPGQASWVRVQCSNARMWSPCEQIIGNFRVKDQPSPNCGRDREGIDSISTFGTLSKSKKLRRLAHPAGQMHAA